MVEKRTLHCWKDYGEHLADTLGFDPDLLGCLGSVGRGHVHAGEGPRRRPRVHARQRLQRELRGAATSTLVTPTYSKSFVGLFVNMFACRMYPRAMRSLLCPDCRMRSCS